jgi:hypothetical protein
MPDTKTPVEIPAQWTRDGAPSHRETAWKEALDAVEPFLAPELVGSLEDAAAGRAIGAYDFGVEWGLGHFPETETDTPGYVTLNGIRAALRRIDGLLKRLAVAS